MTTTAAKERPILFRGEMVRAILDGAKTQTRRLMKPQPEPDPTNPGKHWWPSNWVQSMMSIEDELCGEDKTMAPYFCPYGKIGDRLWVRETFSDPFPLDIECKNFTGFFRATDPDRKAKWKPSIFMPRWACRLVLEITDVRVERLNDISHEDAIAEGCQGYNWVSSSPYFAGPHTDDGELPQEEYRTLWESINGVGSWAANPMVWVISFRRIEA